MISYSTNTTVIEKLMNGEALESLSYDYYKVQFHKSCGWVERKLLKEVNELIDIIQIESTKF